MTEKCDYLMVVAKPKRWHPRHFWRIHGCGVLNEYRGRRTVQEAREDAQKLAELLKAAVVLVNFTDRTIEQVNHSEDGHIKIDIPDAEEWMRGRDAKDL